MCHARENSASFLRVRRVQFFELPTTVSGKICRVQLRVREGQIAGTTTTTEWRDDQFLELRGGGA